VTSFYILVVSALRENNRFQYALLQIIFAILIILVVVYDIKAARKDTTDSLIIA
jgi:uncharacterized membrane protein YqjE